MLKIRANKIQTVKLMHHYGYHPQIKSCRYETLNHGTSIFLTWIEDNTLYQAYLTAAGGRPYLRVSADGNNREIRVAVETLVRFNLTREIK